MLKKITEPQAQYFKQGQQLSGAGYPAQPNMSATSNPPGKKFNKKIITSIFAVALFLVVGVAGVMTALRQQQVAGPVAPNAPSSKPLAAMEPGTSCKFCAGVCGNFGANDACAASPVPPTGYSCVQNPTLQEPYCITVPSANSPVCAMPFTIASVVPSPSPSAEPVPITASCVQKNAFLVATGGTTTELAPNAAVSGNSVIKYELTIQTSGTPTNPLIVEDQLAANTTFDEAASVPPTGVVFDLQAGNKLKITIQPYAGSKVIPYFVKATQKTQPYTFVNNAKISNNGSNVAGNSCSISLKTSPSGVAVCSSKTAYTMDASNNKTAIANNGTLKAGTEFYYRIKVEAPGETTGAVTVKDTLPAGIQYVSGVKPDGITTATDTNGRTVVTANLGTIGAEATDDAEAHSVVFKVKLGANVDPATLKNIALVSTAGSTTTSSCDHNIVVPPEGVASCEWKDMHTASYKDNKPESETRISNGSSLTENREFYYRFKVTSTKQTTGAVNIIDKLPSALEVVSGLDFTNKSGQMVATVDAFTGEKYVEMKVKIKQGVQGTVTNTAQVDTENSGKAAVSCESSFTVPSYTCNSSCESDGQCTRADANFRCVSTTDGMRCRLGSNHASTSCQGTTTSTPAPSSTPTVGCNYNCSTNADCTNPAHICYQTTNGGRCRLDSNVTSESCTRPVTTTPNTPAQPGQPVLPQELPQTGPEDWANWLKAGLVTLGIGAILLLLL
jgi:fimbrial isopeptide formation D2 family protein